MDKFDIKNNFYNILVEIENRLNFKVIQNQSMNDICLTISNLLSKRVIKCEETEKLFKKLENLSYEYNKIKELENDIETVRGNFCPFGWLDVEAAVKTAKSAGKSADFVNEAVESMLDHFGYDKLEDVDPVYAVYYKLFDEVRTRLLEFLDLENEDQLTEILDVIEIYGNYLDTSFDCNQETKEKIQELIKEKIKTGIYDELLLWFFDELEIKIEA